MSRSISAPRGRTPYALLLLLATLALLFSWWQLAPPPDPGTGFVYARSTESTDALFDYEVAFTDITVDWTPADGGDFDPRDKCPKDFFSAGFIVLSRKVKDGAFTNFLHHRGKAAAVPHRPGYRPGESPDRSTLGDRDPLQRQIPHRRRNFSGW